MFFWFARVKWFARGTSFYYYYYPFFDRLKTFFTFDRTLAYLLCSYKQQTILKQLNKIDSTVFRPKLFIIQITLIWLNRNTILYCNAR